MKNLAALVSVSLVVGVYALGACTAGRDILFIDPPDKGDDSSTAAGAGGAGPSTNSSTTTTTTTTTTGGAGGSVIAGGNGTTGIGATTGAGSGGGSSTSSSGAGGSGPVDCANIPKGPFSYKVKLGQKASEDMDFDNAGNLIGADGGNIFKSTFAGQSQIWVPGSGDFIAGLRFTSKGVLIMANVTANALFKVEAPATKTFLVGGLSYPNGMDADNVGRIAVAEQNSSQLRRVNPETMESEILATGLNNANGVSYSPDYKSIYVGSFGGNIIYKVSLDAQDKPIGTTTFIQNFTQNGTLDGMGVDACGNVYVCEYIAAKVWRIPPSGQGVELVVDLSADTGWIPNMQWGSGVGGWDPLVLYVRDISSGKMYEVPVGVPGKPRKYP